MITDMINQGVSCVRSLTWSDTRPLSVDERTALALVSGARLPLLPPVSQADRRYSI